MLHVHNASLGILLFYDAHKKPPAHRYIFIIIYNDANVNLCYNNSRVVSRALGQQPDHRNSSFLRITFSISGQSIVASANRF